MNTLNVKLLIIAITTLAAPGLLFAEANSDYSDTHSMDHSRYSAEQSAKDNWKQAKLDGIFTVNEALSTFEIDTEVVGSTVILNGVVDTEATRQLAEEKAIGIEGITKVESNLTVDKDVEIVHSQKIDKKPGVGQKFIDASITASVKTKLIGSDVKARNINVDTTNGAVLLKGSVASEAHKTVAENIARNTKNVTEVVSELKINQNTAAK